MKEINYNYFLDELIENHKAGIDNVNKVINDEIKLKNFIIDNRKNKNDFKELVDNIDSKIKEYSNQNRIIQYRLDKLNEIKSDLNSYQISLVLQAFGLANKEGKSLEDRIKNKEKTID